MLNSLRPSERLLAAVTSNDEAGLLEAIADGADVNFRRTKNTPILLALDRGNKECAKILMEHGADINLDNGFGWLPVHEICRHGWEDWIETLLKNPMASTDRRDREGASPLLIALINGHEGVASRLVANGSNVNAQNEQGVSPLMLAIERQSPGLVQQMMERRGDASLADSTGRSGFDRAENWPEGQVILGAPSAKAAVSTATSSAESVPAESAPETQEAETGVSGIQKRRRPS
jgi:hypothetical protein